MRLFLFLLCFFNFTFVEANFKIIVAQTPGTSPDIIARIVSDALSKSYSKPTIVLNKPGAGGTVAISEIMKMPPDGYHLFATSTGPISMNPFLFKNLSYDPEKDFSIIYSVGFTPAAIVSNNDVKFNTIKEIVESSKIKQINYGTGGVKFLPHIIGELLNYQTKGNLVMIPYKGAPLGITDTIAGRVPLFFDIFGVVEPFISSGKLKPIAITSKNRLTEYPSIATVNEFYPNFPSMMAWFVVVGPTGISQEIKEELNQSLNQTLKQTEFRERLNKMFIIDRGGSLSKTEQIFKEEREKFKKIIKELQIESE